MSMPNLLAVAAVPAVAAVHGPSEDGAAPWPPGTLLRLLQAADGGWELRALDDDPSQAGAGGGAVMPLSEPPLPDLQLGEVLVLRVTQFDIGRGEPPRMQLEIVDRQVPPRLEMAAAIEEDLAEALLPAMQANVPSWNLASIGLMNGAPSSLPPTAEVRLLESAAARVMPEAMAPVEEVPASGRPALDWARASLPLLARGLPPAEPFEHRLWVHSQSLSDWLAGGSHGIRPWPAPAADAPAAGAGLSVLLAWRGPVLRLELSGRRSELALDFATSSTLTLAALQRAWPHLALSLARTGWRVRRLHFRRRYLRLPAQRPAVAVDADLLWAAGEILSNL